MDFATAARLGTYISKDYARDMFELLAKYRDISASEAASRLGLHIRTAQDFLEAMESLGILSKEEVYEKKRPYFRYTLVRSRITMDIDLEGMGGEGPGEESGAKIREKKDSGAIFTTARSGDRISSVTVWTGEGRDRKERRISLTGPQGSFLFHLPFPNAAPMSIEAIMEKAGADPSCAPEIRDLVEVLTESGVIETDKGQ
jgi:DNA-binding Lrp family transcriptional regulator